MIDYGEIIIKIRKNEIETVEIQIKSELMKGVSALPPRSETFKVFHIKSKKFPCVIEPQEIENGILVPSSIVHQPKSWLRVLNTHDNVKIINTEDIKSSPLKDFHILQIEKNDACTTNRLRTLQNTLRKKSLNL